MAIGAKKFNYKHYIRQAHRYSRERGDDRSIKFETGRPETRQDLIIHVIAEALASLRKQINLISLLLTA